MRCSTSSSVRRLAVAPTDAAVYSSRRAAIRAHSQLVTVFYRKTLVRRDMAGARQKAAKEAGKEDAGDDDEEDDSAKKDTASAGKVLNLLASDIEKISQEAVSLFLAVECPVQIVVALVLLYGYALRRFQCSLTAQTARLERLCRPRRHRHPLSGPAAPHQARRRHHQEAQVGRGQALRGHAVGARRHQTVEEVSSRVVDQADDPAATAGSRR